MSASVVSPYMFRSYTWPSSGDVPCTMLLSALLLRHNFTWVCGRIFYLCCCHVYLSAVGLVVVFKSNKLNACDILLRSNVIHIMQIKYSWKKKKDKKKEKWGTFAPQWHQNNCSTDTSSLFMWVQTRIEKMMEITLKFNVFVYNSAML